MKTTKELTGEKLQDIYINEQFRNEVAYAVGCYSADNKFKHFKTVSYPAEYIVTEAQIELAKSEIEKAKALRIQGIRSNPETLVFVGMGMSYASRYLGDICNHRIRTRFINNQGHRFFIEVGTYGVDRMRCDHSIDLDLQYLHDLKLNDLYDRRNQVKRYSTEWDKLSAAISNYEKQPYNNFGGIEGTTSRQYTFENLLKLINGTFDCDFKSIEIDNYNLDSDEFICGDTKKFVQQYKTLKTLEVR